MSLKVLFYFYALISPFASAEELVKTCPLTGKHKEIQLLREQGIHDTFIYSIKVDGQKRFVYETPESSRGSDVTVQCIGKYQRALFFRGEFHANYSQGFVLTANGRLDFAERAIPERIYLNREGIVVVIPLNGMGEFGTRYVVYSQRGNNPEPEVKGMDVYPSSDGFEVVDDAFHPGVMR